MSVKILAQRFIMPVYKQVTFIAKINGYLLYPRSKQAEQIDEMLWAFDSDSFVPHNLVGEGPKQGAAVEISYQAPQGRRPCLINLTSTVPDFAQSISIDC